MERIINYSVEFTGEQIRERVTLCVFNNKGEPIAEEKTVYVEPIINVVSNSILHSTFEYIDKIIEQEPEYNDRFHATIKDSDSDEIVAYVHISTMFSRDKQAKNIGIMLKDIISKRIGG